MSSMLENVPVTVTPGDLDSNDYFHVPVQTLTVKRTAISAVICTVIHIGMI